MSSFPPGLTEPWTLIVIVDVSVSSGDVKTKTNAPGILQFTSTP